MMNGIKNITYNGMEEVNSVYVASYTLDEPSDDEWNQIAQKSIVKYLTQFLGHAPSLAEIQAWKESLYDDANARMGAS